jgi:sulfite reductase (NADPH) hemoprotein beta-component
MYQYNPRDHQLVGERVKQFRGQTERYLAGQLSDEQFLPLRLQNGLYIQRLAPMLRIAIPYGLLSSRQLRKLAEVTRTYDKGYAHFTTRQNLQLNWPQLESVPDILAELASVEMHAVQTSGNCIRNVTSDQFAGVAPDEIEDPRPWCELLRQWSTLHPEFAYLPRKFKIAVNGSQADRAAFLFHDVGVEIVRNAAGQTRFNIYAGGGLGRTPVIGELVRSDLEPKHLLTYLDALLRVYNSHGNRANKYKARIKILVKAWGVERFARAVEDEWLVDKDGANTLADDAIDAMKQHFTLPTYQPPHPSAEQQLQDQANSELAFKRWLSRNSHEHKQPGYRAVTLSLKPTGVAPGDVTDRQLETIAQLADDYSFGEVRATHNQNVVLADVRIDQLHALWQAARTAGFATPTVGTLTDMICCPGGDFCSLANAKSIPVAESLQRRFDDIDYLYDLGDLELNISGCMNACGHHHVGQIGILGVDKKGEEWYQIQIGGSPGKDAALAKVLGPAFSRDQVADTVATLLTVYTELRHDGESFLEVYRRVGLDPFKERVYAKVN